MKYVIRTTEGVQPVLADAYVLDDQGLKLYRAGNLVAMFRVFEWFRVDEASTPQAGTQAEETEGAE